MAAVPTYRARSTVNSASSIATVSGAAIGTAAPDRIVVVSVGWIENAGAASITGVTIGGIAATQLVSVTDPATNDKHLDMWGAVVPSGTTADIVVTFNLGEASTTIAHYTVAGGKLPVSDIDSAQGSAATIALAALTIPTNGCAIVTFVNQAGGTAVTWTNATENFDEDSVGAVLRHSGATRTTAGTTTITADGATNDQCLVGAAFEPGQSVPVKVQDYRRRRAA